MNWSRNLLLSLTEDHKFWMRHKAFQKALWKLSLLKLLSVLSLKQKPEATWNLNVSLGWFKSIEPFQFNCCEPSNIFVIIANSRNILRQLGNSWRKTHLPSHKRCCLRPLLWWWDFQLHTARDTCNRQSLWSVCFLSSSWSRCLKKPKINLPFVIQLSSYLPSMADLMIWRDLLETRKSFVIGINKKNYKNIRLQINAGWNRWRLWRMLTLYSLVSWLNHSVHLAFVTEARHCRDKTWH